MPPISIYVTALMQFHVHVHDFVPQLILLPNNSIICYIIYYVLCFIYAVTGCPRWSHKSFLHTQKLYETETFLNASVNQKNAIKWNENRNKNGITNGKTREQKKPRDILLKFLRIVAEIRNDAISLSHECHKSIVKSTEAASRCAPLCPFPHCQRVKSIRAGCAPVQFDSCQSAILAAFSPTVPRCFPLFPFNF